MNSRWNRRIGAALAAATVLLGVTACGSDSGTTDADKPTSASADAGQYPVTVSGKFGEATIESAPTRAMPLSPQDADILLSLGVTPIAIPVDAQNRAATGGSGVWPWQVEAFGGKTPETLDMETGAGSITERLAVLEPDIIVSTGFWGLDQAAYDQLSKQFPVVHFDTKANGEPWQDSTRKVAAALGIPAKAEEVIAAAEADLAKARADNPTIAGKTYNAIIGDTGGQLSVLASDERGIGQFLTSLGLVLSPYATTLPVDADGRGILSYENVGDMNADVLFVVSPTGDLGYLTKFEGWNALPAVQDGAVVSLARNTGLPNAVGFPSALSLGWATDQVMPLISDAVAKGAAG
ncbi:ABC transporter substrate-binding protein [Rhodococcus sp. ACPA4]|uniref:ABC transporter substrate-binding protein n=1 Tax=Rhodococcus TaxID=1827 RepID=UPI0005D3CC10|nr:MULTISPECIES: ABC transporter substrate-binding protein [Rhodococcus]KJF23720.1 putative ABC transporter substrate-binding lipoprotein yhfQ precursor [Rhodococcus sp. AD45]PBC42591.1 ABC transporter substrate-binding protein [Rhodococcus sp. ACPA4]PSR42115.1 ABC transporter substrate-binding protein [Rhodococcus sp. AD45-ID]QXW04857.1 ABC transporter substrate-binding protein [Rhodococcus globerulus]